MIRTVLIVFIAALFISNQAGAQIPGVKKVTSIIPKVMFGIKAGANFNELTSSGTFTQSYNGGLMGGLFLGLHGRKIGLQAEAMVRAAKFVSKLSSGDYIATVNMDVPLLLEYKIVPRLWVQLGPQYTAILSKTDHNSSFSTAFNSSDFSAVAGLQAILPLHLVVGARYIFGFAEQNKITASTDSWKNRAFQLYLGFRFI